MPVRAHAAPSTDITTGLKATRRRLVSIRWTLPICVVTPLVSGILLTSCLAFRSGQTAVDELVGKISTEVAANIEKQVASYLAQPSMVSAAVSAEVASGNINTQDTRELGQDLWQLTQSDLLTNNFYYGSKSGEFVYSQRQGDQSRLDFVDDATDFRRIAYQTDASGNLTEQLSVTDYDPRVRTWYKEAAFHEAPVWSQVYVAKSRADLTLTRATPIVNKSGQVEGVFGIDVYLFELSNFLRNLAVSPNGRAFIIEKSGDLIAISADEKPFIERGDDKLRLAAVDSQDPLVRATASHLLKATGDLEQIDSHYSFEFELEGQKQVAHIYQLQELGVNWLIGVTIPQDDYMETIHANARHTLMIGVTVTIIASLLALAAALYIIRPIHQLNQAAADIKLNRFNPDDLSGVIARPDEFSELAELFNDMAMVVVSREQSLAEQVKLLKTEIDQSGGSGGDCQKLEALLKRAKQVRKSYPKR
ncbi:MAG: cache domain-containing protein [Cyanobacteria bacterium P01_D01_bin.44]